LEENFEVYIAADIGGAMSVLEREQVDLMLTDLRLAGEDGMALVEKALAMPHPPIVIMMTAYGSVDAAVEAMKRGAYDFVTKPLNIDRLEILIQRALRSKKVEKEVVELKQQVDRKFGLENIVGESLPMHDIFDTIRQVAPTRATVLIQGESGTGKELVAHAIHSLSGRPKQKFVTVHCAGFNAQLLESELFGHERGAFTGAVERRIGRFEQANGGTIFLDEIGEIDAATQVKLLRVLGEDRTFERVGSNTPIKVDVRVVAATNKDLARLVAEGKFREDLFFRLSVVKITTPPLRQRKEDIPLLVNAFLKQFAEENNKPVPEITSEAMDALLRYDWPGNVRKLRNVIENTVVMTSGNKIGLRNIPVEVREASDGGGALSSTKFIPTKGNLYNIKQTEYKLILQALEETGGNVTQAAKKLGISRRTLHRKINELKGQENADS
jgi:DNA-binding NtrC family response regulator